MGKRIWQLDALRGMAMVLMAAYHLLVDLRDFFGVAGIEYSRPPLLLIGRASAVTFILVAGASCTLSKSNLRRGARVFAGGMAITAATWLYGPTRALYIRFGILHFLGAAMAIVGAAQLICARARGKAADGFGRTPQQHEMPQQHGLPTQHSLPTQPGLPTQHSLPTQHGSPQPGGMAAAAAWLAAAVACAALGAAFRGRTTTFPFLFPLGLEPVGFATYDYYPLFPWLAVFFAGVAAGRALLHGSAGKKIAEAREPAAFRALGAFGRRAFIFYFAHQPALIAILALWFRALAPLF